jgi:predicted MFS family arabinose efflux permease
LVASAAGYLGLAVTAGSLGGGLAMLAFTFIAFEITIVAAVPLATEAAPGARSRFLAWLMVFIGIGRALGDATGPALYSWNGMPATSVVSAVVAGVAMIVIWVGLTGSGRQLR